MRSPISTIELLDPETCKVLASGDLPAESGTVAFGDGKDAGKLTIEIAARPQPFSGRLPPIDERCLGSERLELFRMIGTNSRIAFR